MSIGHTFSKLIGEALFLASFQSSWGSVEMSSKYSVLNFSKDQETLQSAADALSTYIIIALVWTLATMFVLYSEYGCTGLVYGLIMNLIFTGWIIFSYIMVFRSATKRHNLQFPKLFNFFK